MRRPRLTRNILDGLNLSLAHAHGLWWDMHISHVADGNPSKLNEEDKKEYEQHEKASLYVAELNRWHKWKQEQRKGK